MDAELIAKQWPGFTVTCDKCGSREIELQNSLGWSDLSGSWGSIDLRCNKCDHSVSIVDAW